MMTRTSKSEGNGSLDNQNWRAAPALLRSLALPAALIVATPLFLPATAQALPSVVIGRPALISPAAADSAFPTANDSSSTQTLGPTAPAEVSELARALGHDLDSIYGFVRNYVDTVFVFGAQKGALGSIIDKSGTPFDQAQLMVNLLQQTPSPVTLATYKYGTITLTGAQFAAWTNITNAQAACELLASGGIPATINGGSGSILCSSIAAGATVSTVTMGHVWVDVTIGTNHYLFDPSYKPYNFKAQVSNLKTAAGLTTGEAMNASISAGSGYTTGTNGGVTYAKALNGTALQTKLGTYATNLQTYIQTQNSAAGTPLVTGRIIDLVGGREIARCTTSPQTCVLRQSSLPYTSSATRTWSNIPDQFRTKMVINLTKYTSSQTYAQVVPDTNVFVDDIYGRRLVFNSNFVTHQPATYTGGLYVVDEMGHATALVTPFTNADDPNYSVGTLTLKVNHPYPADASPTSTVASGTYMDALYSRTFRFSTPFMIVHGWGDTNRGLADKWGQLSDGSLPMQPPNGCESCTTDYFASDQSGIRGQMAASWLVQSSKAARMHAAIANAVYTHHHSIGIVSGDTVVKSVIIGQGQPPTYNWSISDNFNRIDVESGISVTSLTETSVDRRVALHAIAATLDALEGSVADQQSDLPDVVSTAARFEWGNSTHTAAEDPSSADGATSIGPRRFYEFTPANGSNYNNVAPLIFTEGKTSTTQVDYHPGDNPTLGQTEIDSRRGAVAQLINSYAAGPGTGTWDVIASEEAFLGPGQRGGTFQKAVGNNLYSHDYSAQRGGAFVATRYDSGGDPVEIAHIAANVSFDGSTPIGIKGGGGGAQTMHQAMYDPSTAADILKSKFVDRAKAEGVDLGSGDVTFESPAQLTVGSGDFPYSLNAKYIWRGGYPQAYAYAAIGHTAPNTPFTTNWNSSLMISGSALEALGETDIRASAGTVAAFLAMQDIYRAAVSPQREVTALLAGAWWTHQITHNVISVNLGADTAQFVKKYDGTYFAPGPGKFATLTKTGIETIYSQPSCGGGPVYVTTRGWDYSGVAFTVTNATGDQQNYSFWGTNFKDSTSTYCAFQHGFRLSTWTFPYGMSINLVYQASAPNQLEDLVEVNNSIGRKIKFTLSGLTGFNNGLSGADLRSVSSTQVSLSSTSVTHTSPVAAEQTVIGFSFQGSKYQLDSVVRKDGSNPALSYPQIAYSYDTLGRVKQAQDAVALQLGTRPAYSFYLAEGAQAARIDPAGGQYTVINDIYHRAIAYIDELGRQTSADYDGRGRLITRTYPEGNKEVFQYDDRNNTSAFIRKPKAGSGLADIAVSATWDATWNKPLSTTDELGCITTFGYFATNPGKSLLQTATRCKPDASQANPVYSFTYNASGLPLTATDPSSLIVSNAYDASFNLASVTTDPTGVNATVLYGYDANGNNTSVTDPRGYVKETAYDLDGRKVQVLHHDGSIAAGLVAAEKTSFDILGRATEVDSGTAFSGISVTNWQMTRLMTYTPNSLILTEQDGMGAVGTTTHFYDALDREVMSTDPSGLRTASVYDAAGEKIANWKGWNSDTPPTNLTQPTVFTGTEPIRYALYSYTANGQLATVLDANNNLTTSTYDGVDRLSKLSFPLPTPGAQASSTTDFETYSYDAGSHIKLLTRRDGQQINHYYDLLGRLTQKVLPNSTSGDIYTDYDLAGRVTHVLFGSPVPTTGTGIDYGYDTAKRVVTETSFGRTLTYGYDASGNRTRIAWPTPDTNYISYDYDALNRNYQIRENGATSGTGVLAQYQYDALSRQQSITRGNNVVSSYSYDLASRLTNYAHDFAGTAQDLSVGLQYTASSSLKSRMGNNSTFDWLATAGSHSYSPTGTDSYSSVDGNAYTYDARGNLKSDGTRTFSYDVENKLLSVAGGAGMSLSYDPTGRLRQTVSGSTTTQFLYDGDRLSAEYSDTGVLLRRYVFGPGQDTPIVWYEGSGLSDRRALHADERGSIIATSDGTGAATVYAYGAYGEPSSWNGSRFRYTGQIALPEGQIYFYKARAYDPKLGRFLQTDPIGQADNLNLYSYTANNPLNAVDPTGLSCTGSRLTNDDGTCASTGGFTTGSQGVAQGVAINRARAELWAKIGAAIGAGVSATGAVVVDYGTAGANIPANPAEVAGGMALGAAAGGSASVLMDQMAAEIEKLSQRMAGPEAEQYSLRANTSGMYPSVRGGVVFLNAGDVYKYGQTTLPTSRYSGPELGSLGMRYVTEFRGSQQQALIQEKIKIYSYLIEHHTLPPGNRIRR